LATQRGEFSSRIGFILAATGSAVGLGNVWGFPTNTASNGGAAFVLVYLVLAFCLAYPALMAELIIGRYCRANIVSALVSLPNSRLLRSTGALAGIIGIITASAILGFYALIAGWMLAQLFAHAAELAGISSLGVWFGTASTARDLACALAFSLVTILLVSEGVKRGIERWSTRLMPAFIALLVVLIAYVMTLEGAVTGLKVYLLPDFSRLFHPTLILSALGQAFFSLSLGVGTMLIYGSYIPRTANLPTLGAAVTLVDIAIAFLAGLLILPAMFVAQNQGITIYENDQLIAGPDLIFQVLPTLFETLGTAGLVAATVFFSLMTVAALTSSISMLEVPTSLVAEVTPLSRRTASWLCGGLIFCLTTALIVWFDPLFSTVTRVTTEYSEPLMGIVLCLFAGWAIHRNRLLEALRLGNASIEDSLFWKLWPTYVRYFCPLLIAAAFIQSLR
jgi:neurotransmitter:Na+ symporter, NSS family